jgi:hypothetical protein
MSEFVSYTPFYYDPRGNRLERWEVAGVDGGRTGVSEQNLPRKWRWRVDS